MIVLWLSFSITYLFKFLVLSKLSIINNRFLIFFVYDSKWIILWVFCSVSVKSEAVSVVSLLDNKGSKLEIDTQTTDKR